MKVNVVIIKAIKIIAAFLLLFSVGVVYFLREDYKAMASASGPPPAFTGAPAENSCISCHSFFPVNSGTGRIEILGIPETYLPGQAIPVSVKVTDANAVVYGFQITAVDETGTGAGSFQLPPVMPPTAQIVNGLVGGLPRQYVHHTVDGLFTDEVFGSNTWTLSWTAPMEQAGKIDFYAAGIGSDSDGMTTGDYTYTTSVSSLPEAPPLVSISGTVFGEDGRVLRGAFVILTDSGGNSRILTTSNFGTFSFTQVESGQTYVLTANSKRYRFARKDLNVTDNLTGVDFFGVE